MTGCSAYNLQGMRLSQEIDLRGSLSMTLVCDDSLLGIVADGNCFYTRISVCLLV